MERVILHGGPGGSQTFEFDGGEFLNYCPPPDLPMATFKPDKPADASKTDTKISLYRRSVNNPKAFVFQP